MNNHHSSLRVRMAAILLAILCVLGVIPVHSAAAADTIKLESFGNSGVHYQSAQLGSCMMHEMYFAHNAQSLTGFCADKGMGMGTDLVGQTWGDPKPITDPTVKVFAGFFYSNTLRIYTDKAKAMGLEANWSPYTKWYMNALVQAIIWRYKAGTLNNPTEDCAEEMMYVFNVLDHKTYTSIDDTYDGISFRDWVQSVLDEGTEVWGDWDVYEYTHKGAGTSYHPAGSVQGIIIANPPEDTTEESYSLTVKKVDATNPNKGLPGARFHVQSANGSYSKDIVTGSDGTYTVVNIPAGTYEVTELEAPEGYEIDNAGPQYATVPNGNNNTVTVTFTDTPEVSTSGSIRKVDADDPTKGLAGAVIKITGVDNDFTGTYVTGTGGYLTDLNWKDLPIGSYTAEEITPPEGYSISPDVSKVKQTFEWDGKTPVALVFENDAKVKVQLIKQDDSGNPLAGAVFNVLKDGQIIASEATNEAGEIIVPNVTEGMYTFVEVSAPEGYNKVEHPVVAHVDQMDIAGGGTVTVTAVDKRLPELTVSKVDAVSGQPIPGTVFTVEGVDSDYRDDWTTGQDGTVSKPVLPGVYRVTEKSVPAPYYLPSKNEDREQTISLNAGDTKTLVFKDYKAPELTVYKVDSVAGAPVEGARFHVTYTSNGESEDGPESVDFGEILTDANGEIRLHEQGKRLYPGEYTVTEVAPASGFQMKDPTTQKVILHGGESKTLTFENVPLNAVIVEKYDSVTHEALPGCTFQLRYLGGTSGTGGTVIGQKVTGKNGTCIWTGLQSGTYLVEEVDPADGYSIIQSSETVYLADSGEQSVITVRFENMPDGNLLIRKVCSVNPSVTLQDAEFKITYADGSLIGDSNGIYRTDENGEIRISGLKPGASVIVTETRAPAGFILDSQSQTVQIKAGRTVSLTFKNQPKGELIVQKRDSDTGEPLPGAEFRITTAAGCEVGLDGVIGSSTLTQNGIFTTDAQGEIHISNLAPGAYVVTEIKAPDGYVMDSASTNVVIGANGDTQTVVIKNSKKGGLIVHKLDSVTKEPLEGVQFKITYADGRVVDAEGGKLSSNGLYWTDENGQIVLDGITGTLVVTEVQTIPGYTIHEETRSQTVLVNPDDTQELWFYNDPVGGVELIKADASDTTKRLANATFEIRRMDDGLVDTVTTDSNGRVFLDLEDGSYYAVEIKAPDGYKLDNTPHYFQVKDGKSPTVTVTNQPFSGIIIHKIDSVTGEGVYGVTFLVYDSTMHPIDQVTTDQDGYVYLDSLDFSGKLFLREMEAEGYVVDTQLKTVYVKPGEVTEITWENTPITGQIQITKTSEDYNSVNGWPAGTPLPGTVFEIYNRAGNLVDTIETDKFGIARSRALPLGRYTIRETKATQFYGISNDAMEVEIEFAGQIVRVAMTNKSLYTSVSITKRGYHPAIIPPEMFDRVQAESARRNAIKSASRKVPTGRSCYASKYALSERLFCGECGTRYQRCTWNKRGKKQIVWRCVSRVEYGSKYCHDSPTMEERPLQEAILAAINRVMSDKKTLIWQIKGAMELELVSLPGQTISLADIDKRLEELAAEFDTILDRVTEQEEAADCLDDFQAIANEIAALKEQKRQIEAQHRKDAAAVQKLADTAQALEGASPAIQEWNEGIIRQLVDSVKVISKEKIIVGLSNGIQIEQTVVQ